MVGAASLGYLRDFGFGSKWRRRTQLQRRSCGGTSPKCAVLRGACSMGEVPAVDMIDPTIAADFVPGEPGEQSQATHSLSPIELDES